MAKYKNTIGILETNNAALIDLYRASGYEEIIEEEITEEDITEETTPEEIPEEPAVNIVKEKPKGKKNAESE